MSNVMDKMGDKCKTFYFNWLTELKEDGLINIYAAPAIMVNEFHLTHRQAVQITTAWMESYEEKQ